jgi:glycosyltransferase involved in cell wall biosynthesis
MAAGLPVAATEVGDVPWMVSRDNLPFVTARADEALAQALKQLLGDPELRLAVGAANRRKARLDYDQRAMFAAYEAIFRNTPAH